jgi:hypothetical protein
MDAAATFATAAIVINTATASTAGTTISVDAVAAAKF